MSPQNLDMGIFVCGTQIAYMAKPPMLALIYSAEDMAQILFTFPFISQRDY